MYARRLKSNIHKGMNMKNQSHSVPSSSCSEDTEQVPAFPVHGCKEAIMSIPAVRYYSESNVYKKVEIEYPQGNEYEEPVPFSLIIQS
ncbi:hypothetical protein JTE90_001613 [Oedothorax gibbosus]|uniref:Uncharacterized protein n=1 Tax=Oedothorax gibbosus TaxID=931172 RepID=A0AAV6VMB1_9ARAC|nr:hypothetical protein JTE90_001613 [Oedothorax gibbosus]